MVLSYLINIFIDLFIFIPLAITTHLTPSSQLKPLNLLNLITLTLHFNYMAKFFKFSQISSYDKIVTFIKFNSNSIKFIKK
ncbi:hypothetical protein, partial [Campylobacter vicugnae]|uniref:hypothetical protein n=1 Tax=Campylobacter vicugnae TaxID=1660076 RepID=UPI001F338880